MYHPKLHGHKDGGQSRETVPLLYSHSQGYICILTWITCLHDDIWLLLPKELKWKREKERMEEGRVEEREKRLLEKV